MHVIVTSVGTDGDILPYVGLGCALKARGHRVTLVASEDYATLASSHQLAFASLVSRDENEELFGHPDFWHPLKTARISARWGARFLPRQLKLLNDIAEGPDTVIVANPGVLAAGVLAESRRIPWVTLVLQPWMIPSSLRPPYFHGLGWLRPAPRPVWNAFWWGLDKTVEALMGRELNRLRASVGLAPVRGEFLRRWLSPELVLGMFPDWYGNQAPDWPSQLKLVHFPFFDGDPTRSLPPDVASFCKNGAPPIAFTFGTGMRHSAALFRVAMEACEAGGWRAIFLTKFRDQLPKELPSHILHTPFAPFAELFPRCAAVVHHGGIGTTAQALASGTPQLLLAICFDQPDNGERVKALGAGDWMHARRARPAKVAEALARLVAPESRVRAGGVSQRMKGSPALESAADHVEGLCRLRLSTAEELKR